MKLETKFTKHISSGHGDRASQNTSDSERYEHQKASKAQCFHPIEKCDEFSVDDREISIAKRFENIVRKYPNRLAVKMGDQKLTYDQLNKAANRIARAILAQRRKNNEPIALLFEHGVDLIASLFGTLKAGKFYVVLDSTFPVQRNRYMLDDSQSALILTNTRNHHLAHKLTGNGRAILNIDETEHGFSSDDLGLFVAPQDHLCIQYTSGSTGKPKGILSDQGLHSRLYLEIPISPDDKFSLLHSVSFGSATLNLFLSLLNGAALFPFDVKSEGVVRLSNWLCEEQITICHLPPSLFSQLMDAISDPEKLSHLRMITLSGSPITRRDFELYKDKCPAITLLRFFMGSSETGQIISAVVDHRFNYPEVGTPLGYSYPGKKVLLLDDNKGLVGPNQVGEIAIQTARVLHRYWNRPDISGANCLSDPNCRDKHISLTGDLGRMLPDGFLLHMGRKDLMVKIRGYRVELGEIEGALREHPKIREAGVTAWDREPGEKYLAAYVVPRQGVSPPVDELRNFIKAKLPDYMIPSSFVFLESLPLTNGKLDRAALPKPSIERPELTRPFISPRNGVEEKLAGIWAEALGLDRVGIYDDFFDLGGHSLVASRLFVEIEKAFGKQLPLTTLFWARNVEQLARIVQHEKWSAPCSLLFPIQSNGSKPPFFWVYGETSDVLLPRYLGPDQPLYGLMHEARTGKRVRYSNLIDIAANHLKDIQTVQPQGPYFLGGFCFGGMVAFEIARQLQKQGQGVALLFLVDLGTLANWRYRFEKTVSFRPKVSHHTRNLARIGAREKVKYIQVRVEDRVKGIISRGKNISKIAACKAYFATGRLLPHSLRPHYISSVDSWAMRHYEPEVYPGDLILFKSEQKSYDPTWVAKLIAGKFQLREVPCSHSDLLKEPDIAVWAKELRASLQKAQTSQRGAHPSVSSKEDAEESLRKQAAATQEV